MWHVEELTKSFEILVGSGQITADFEEVVDVWIFGKSIAKGGEAGDGVVGGEAVADSGCLIRRSFVSQTGTVVLYC
ncbi:hypothetical protein PIB30_082570, partial [Stylosanthes scabra]|nr:hypothetical protein [Stylosanthes scabra]